MEEAILDMWFLRAVEAYPDTTARFLAAEKDRFRNPVGCVLKENLALLLREFLGEMDPTRTREAVSAIVRVRAVQDLTPSLAMGFIFGLKPIVNELMPGSDHGTVSSRIDQLALIAFEEYVRCREKLAELRLNEERRAISVPAAMAQARS